MWVVFAIAAVIIGAPAGLIVVKDDDHRRDGDPRHASRGAFRGAFIALVACCIVIGACICGAVSAHARPSPYPPPDRFNGDRYEARAQMGADVARAVKAKTGAKAQPKKLNRRATAAQRRHLIKSPKRNVPTRLPAPRPVASGDYRAEAVQTRGLAGVIAPLASKAREIVANCGSTVISGVRHTYIAGTGGRLSLHASGQAVDIKGNPACIRAHLRGWPGGASIDYAAVNHTHISYAPGGPEWGRRFAHHRGNHRHKHRHHHRRRT